MGWNRRAFLAAGAPLVAATALASRAEAAPSLPGAAFSAIYGPVTSATGARWHTMVTELSAGQPNPVVDVDADFVIEGASVQKLAVAVALLDAVDRGRLRLSDRVTLTEPFIAPGSGIYENQTELGDSLTLSGVLTAMLQVSDNSAVRMIGSVLPGPEINAILAAKGFVHTRVDPLPDNPNRFWLGVTTPREINDLLFRLATGTLLGKESTAAMLGVMTWSAVGYTDGIRRQMSSAERARIATKYGADEDKRHEAGILFDQAGAPAAVYSFFADRVADEDNYGATNSVVQAHAVLGRALIDTYTALSPLSSRITVRSSAADQRYQP